MQILLIALLLFLPLIANAGEGKIVETDTGIVVEYSGAPADNNPSGGDEKPSANVNGADVPRVEYLAAQIEKLKKEISDIAQRTGKESESELMQKNALLIEKRRQLESYTEEIRQLSGKDQPKEELPVSKPNRRQEMKREMRELKEKRRDLPSSQTPQ